MEGVWRYVLVDDTIPVLVRNRKYYPLFLNVAERQKNKVEIWPFLLQKAYAKTYSSYESLLNENSLDFLNEITGCSVERLLINKVSVAQLERHFNNRNNLFVLNKQEGESSFGYDVVVHKGTNPDTLSIL